MPEDRILIVEDEPAVARSLEHGLKLEGYRIEWAKTGSQAIELTDTFDPHMILLDLRLPDISGFDVCRRLRMSGKRQPVLILTALDDQVDIVLGLELGADDYIVKPYHMRELIARIHALLRRAYGELSEVSDGEKLVFGELQIDLEKLQVSLSGVNVYLTPTEFRLLRYLASHADRPFTREHLIEAVWGYGNEVGSGRTVDVHIRHLRKKLEDNPEDPRWIQTVRGVGYKFSPQ